MAAYSGSTDSPRRLRVEFWTKTLDLGVSSALHIVGLSQTLVLWDIP